jgi:NAD(P)-dependent dehydrogenase (short-subunit alcohol dehydrogenase family)
MTSFSSLRLDGRVAVVLGGTAGIGRALSVGLAEAGADVAPSGRRAGAIDEVAEEILSKGRRVVRVASDVTDRPSLEALRDAVVASLGKIDILVNCAGKISRAPTMDVSEQEWRELVDTNLTGTLRACQVFGKHMLGRGYGRIVNIASLNSFVSLKEVAGYAASKAGIVSLTRSLAVEWGSQGVCVNAIAPGVFRTALNEKLLDGTPRGQELLLRTPMKRFGRVEELVGAAVFLASESASFVNGHTLVVDGGFLASGVNQ